MRILWVSDSPTSPSGFGAVTRAVCRRLAARGHAVEIMGWQAHGSMTRWESIPVHPVRHDLFGADVLLGYLMRIQPQYLITLADVSWMSFLADPGVQRYLDLSGARWVLYYPIDGAKPDGRLPPGWVRMLQTCDLPVAMSRFGAAVSAASGVDCAYVPHGCDLEVFRPPNDREEAKARLGYEGRFVVLSDSRNQPRKLLPRLLDIVGRFTQDKPDVVVHLHTDPEDDAATSALYRYRLRADLEALGLRDRVRFTEGFRMRESGGLSEEELAAVYQAAEVHLLCSWGEGFGLPTLQAASSGVVPIAVAETASRELVEGHGFGIPAEGTMLDEFGLERYLLSRDGAVEALEALYRDRGLLAELSLRSREFALDYAWDRVCDRWEHVLRTAPPRRKPVRSHALDWVAGEQTRAPTLPEEVVSVAKHAFADLPDGARLSFRLAERRQGEVDAAIQRDAFVVGDELSIPVRLPPFFDGAPRAHVGHLLVHPADLALAAALKDVFPGIALSVPKPPDAPSGPRFLSLHELLPALARYVLVIDHHGRDVPGLDVACAALGIPYVGVSRIWPDNGPADRFQQARQLLTDHALSERRRGEAALRAEDAYGRDALETMRAIALAGQPQAEVDREPATPPPEIEMLLVRLRDGAAADAAERVAEHAAVHGGLILMATAGRSLIVAMPKGGKERLEGHALVAFVGGITLDEERKGARALKQLFLENAARQLDERVTAVGAGR